MTKFLLDANLSPKVGRFLTRQLNLDVETLHGLQLGSLSDPEIARRGVRSGRVIITLDSDFESASSGLFEASGGVIFLDLPNIYRSVSEINRILYRFFQNDADSIELENSLVVITENGVSISRTIRRLRPRD